MLRPIFMAIVVSVMVLGGVLPAHTDDRDRDKDDDGNKKGHRAILNAVNSGNSSSDTAHGTLQSQHATQDAAHSALTQQLTDLQTAIASLSTGGSAQPPCGAGTGGQRFVVSPDGTEVCDNTTGLNWQQNPGSDLLDHAGALAHCPTVRAGSRLPEVKELISLVDYTTSNPALPASHPFTIVLSSRYWSATTLAGVPTLAWSVNFSTGDVNTLTNSTFRLVWCVRGG